MPEARRRIIVDGFEPGAMWRFPLILRSVASAFQPPRLVVAFVVVLAMVLPGRLWDAVRGPQLARGELLGRVGEASLEREAAVRGEILARWSPLAQVPEPDGAGPAAIDRAVRATQKQFEAAVERWRLTGGIVASNDVDGGAVAGGGGDAASPAADSSPGNAVQPAAGGVIDANGDGPDVAEPAVPADAPAGPSAARERTDRAALRAQRRLGGFAAIESAVHESVRQVAAGLLSVDLPQAAGGVRQLFVDVPIGAWTHARPTAAVFTPLVLAVWALGGGALARMSAIFIGRGERATVGTAIRFASGAWLHLLLAPLVPLVAACLLLLPAGLLGLTLHVPVVEIVGAVLWGVALIAAAGAAVMLLGLAVGAPMVTAVIAAERCDAIDAAQRPYAFLLRRPLHLAAYLGTAIVASAITYVVAGGVAGLALDLSAWGGGWLGRPDPLLAAEGPPLFGADPFAHGGGAVAGGAGVAGAVIGLWRDLLLLLVAAAVLSTWAAATTSAYLLLRQAVDGQDPEEIWEEGMVPGTFARRAPARSEERGVGVPPTGPAATDGVGGSMTTTTALAPTVTDGGASTSASAASEPASEPASEDPVADDAPATDPSSTDAPDDVSRGDDRRDHRI